MYLKKEKKLIDFVSVDKLDGDFFTLRIHLFMY